MNKDKNTLNKRAKFVQTRVNSRHKSENSHMAVNRLARELFLSPSTIWKDYSKKLDL